MTVLLEIKTLRKHLDHSGNSKECISAYRDQLLKQFACVQKSDLQWQEQHAGVGADRAARVQSRRPQPRDT